MDDQVPQLVNASPRAIKRRRFLRNCFLGGAAVAVAGPAYCLFEAGWLRVLPTTISVPRLPEAFRGLRVAFLSDMHHGPFTSLDYVRDVVRRTNALKPDLVLLGGDYVHREARYIRPCFEVLADLKAPWGVHGVLGNHDHWHGAGATRDAMRAAGVNELTNRGLWLEQAGERLRLAGVGDFWEDEQDLARALGDAAPEETALVVSHNPDFAETIEDRRVGLVLSGHTHGGQVVLPVVGAPRVPSIHGQKYLHGLVQAPATQVFVTRGLGCVTPPVRFACRPEIVLVTLA